MIQRFGKYQILEPIGRGGMGTVFKARDPILDRLVALKVISGDIEVTDELRARFYREAQAGARLNHPHIVTIYDMGEDDGRLFIVMELLDGEELRQLIAERRDVAIEDKLAVMMQVCDGLHYAHERGVIHRDIKPGNIFVLRNGQVKILDFGLAHVATSEVGLTRTGLIVGTLRYISPEQAAGRVDQRSDVFSLGAVFHEFLTFRPLFPGSDPIRILEQLRSEEPIRLTALDPALPADLGVVIERAVSKDPAQRFASLHEMRGQIELVQRRLVEEAQQARARVRDQRARLRQLERALAELIGGTGEGEKGEGGRKSAAVDDPLRLEALLTLEREMAAGVERLEVKAREADRVAPRVERGRALLGGGCLDEAIAEFEAVLAAIPDHARAAEQLDDARRQAAALRQRDLLRRRLEDARAAFQRGSFAVSLQGLEDIAEAASSAGLAGEVAELREATEAALSAKLAAHREEVRRQRRRAEEAQAAAIAGRAQAGLVEADRRAEPLWRAGDEKAGEAQALLGPEEYARAAEVFGEALALYRRAEEGAREAIGREEAQLRRNAAEGAHQRMTGARDAAQAVGAERRAEAPWAAAEVEAVEAQAAFAQEAYPRAGERFEAAAALYRQAQEVADEAARREERLRQREEGEHADRAAAQVRALAEALDASRRAAPSWAEAEHRLSEGRVALAAESHLRARQLLDDAAALYAEAAEQARAALDREREQAESLQARIARLRAAGHAAGVQHRAADVWADAEGKVQEGHQAHEQRAYVDAARAYDHALSLFRQAAEAARDAARQEREQAERARDLMAQRRAIAERQGAPRLAPRAWDEAESKAAEAQSAFDRDDHAAAAQAFERAAGLYRQAEDAIREAIRLEEIRRLRAAAEEAAARASAARVRAAEAGGERWSPDPWLSAETKASGAQAALEGERYTRAARAFDEVAALYEQAEVAAREAATRSELARERERAERARDQMLSGRGAAADAKAAERARDPWASAEASSRRGIRGARPRAPRPGRPGVRGGDRSVSPGRDHRARGRSRGGPSPSAGAGCRGAATRGAVPGDRGRASCGTIGSIGLGPGGGGNGRRRGCPRAGQPCGGPAGLRRRLRALPRGRGDRAPGLPGPGAALASEARSSRRAGGRRAARGGRGGGRAVRGARVVRSRDPVCGERGGACAQRV